MSFSCEEMWPKMRNFLQRENEWFLEKLITYNAKKSESKYDLAKVELIGKRIVLVSSTAVNLCYTSKKILWKV